MSTDTIEAPAPAEAKPKKAPKPTALNLTTQFCKSANPDMHSHCKGSGTNGIYDTHLWFCDCQCHVDQPTCRDCGSRGVEITLEGTCIDTEGCQIAQGVRRANHPAHHQIQQILDEAKQREAETADRRRAERQEARAREVATAEREGRPVPAVRPTRTRREAPTPQRCHCGCAGMTKGGRFVAGHDARLKGVLVRAARQTKPDTGKAATKAEAIKAMAELIARDWPRKHVDAKITEQAESMVDQYGIDKVVDVAVAARYEGR